MTVIDGEVETIELPALPREIGDRFPAGTEFGPRTLSTPYRWFRIGREPMRDGRWMETE